MSRVIFLLACLWVAPAAHADRNGAPREAPKPRNFDWEPLRLMPIQDRGRLKPLETYASDSVLFVTGKRGWNGMSAIEVVFGWLIAFDREWEEEPFIRIDHNGLKARLGLDVGRRYFSPVELDKVPLSELMRDVGTKQRDKERLTDLEKKAVDLQNQRGLLESILSGQGFTVLPNPRGIEETWFPLTALTERVAEVPYTTEQVQRLGAPLRMMLDGFVASNSLAWSQGLNDFVPAVRDVAGGQYPDPQLMKRESHYNNLHPFRVSWILYTAAFILLCVYLVVGKKPVMFAGMAMLVAGLGMHTYGFVLRMMISGRPPVTNMYESVIWVTWGCILFGLAIWAIYRNTVIPAAGTVFAVVGLVLADNLPLVLDPGIHPLEPVLRSNFWLTIHVLTITLSYAAFALSLCLGNVVLGNYLFRPGRTEVTQQYSLYMYRAMQIGVILLAAGTILGGVWADYSWGRFWGWDPKEVWALIALLLYLAVLHGRFTGWLRGFGFAATTVISFLGVLMAWYGVNFVLGVGLHSYGFGSGGMGYVTAYVLAQLGFIGAAYWRYGKAKAAGQLDTAIFPRGAGSA